MAGLAGFLRKKTHPSAEKNHPKNQPNHPKPKKNKPNYPGFFRLVKANFWKKSTFIRKSVRFGAFF